MRKLHHYINDGVDIHDRIEDNAYEIQAALTVTKINNVVSVIVKFGGDVINVESYKMLTSLDNSINESVKGHITNQEKFFHFIETIHT